MKINVQCCSSDDSQQVFGSSCHGPRSEARVLAAGSELAEFSAVERTAGSCAAERCEEDSNLERGGGGANYCLRRETSRRASCSKFLPGEWARRLRMAGPEA